MLIPLILVGIVFLAFLELSKNTVLGWILAIAAFVAFRLIYVRYLKGGRILPRLLAWPVLFAVLFLIARFTEPPYRPIPAVTAKNPVVTDVVTVEQGDLTGVWNEQGTVRVYAGIPYAKPPVGELRWKEPQAPDHWEGVRACDTFAPMSMQKRDSVLFSSLTEIAMYHTFRPRLDDNFREPVSEDSLYLNIWQPEGDVSGLPVLFYIHGGSLSTGQSYYKNYNGEALASQGSIVVTFAYRLNAFGYYANEELAAESPNGTTGNYGLLDQIAALQWVHDNIAAFGGDPDNITIAGESAGASSVNALCVSPLTKGLFRRAVAESSGITAREPYHTFRSMERALASGLSLMEEFDASSVADLRNIPAEELVNAQAANSSMTVDGYAIVEQPYLTYEKGENNEEALLSGFNAHEADVFSLFNKITSDNYVDTLSILYGDAAERVAALVPPGSVPLASDYIVEAGGDAKGAYNFVLSATWFTYSHYNWSRLLAAQGRPCWEYYFTKENGSLRANHAGELPYLYGNLYWNDFAYAEEDFELSELMQQYLLNFVRTGNPNGEGLPEWPLFADAPTEVFEFGSHIGMTEDPYLALYEIIDEVQATK